MGFETRPLLFFQKHSLGSLCAGPCAGCGDAERNQSRPFPLDTGSGAGRAYSTSSQEVQGPKGQDGLAGHSGVGRPPLGQERLPWRPEAHGEKDEAEYRRCLSDAEGGLHEDGQPREQVGETPTQGSSSGSY